MATQTIGHREGGPAMNGNPVSLSLGSRFILGCTRIICLAWLLALCAGERQALGQQIWEFSPYRVQVWLSVDPNMELDEDSKARLITTIHDQLRATFRSAWALDTRIAPQHLHTFFGRGLEQIGLDELTSNELELVVQKDSEQTNAVRNLEAALERLPSIAVSQMDLDRLKTAKNQTKLGTKTLELLDQLLAKCSSEKQTQVAIAQGIEDKSIESALISKSLARNLAKFCRPIALPLPWQSDYLFRELDKAFLVVVDRTMEGVRVKARELDGPMRFLGPTIVRSTCCSEYTAQCICKCVIDAFAPVARVEEVDLRTAKMRLRAGGLILDHENPAFLHTGDVLQPVIRRDDRNGVPALLEALPWTFAVVTRTNGIKLDANVYSGIRGALQGQRNNRTQRVLMRVRPTGNTTDVHVVVKGANHVPQSGCEILVRDLASEDLKSIGRTDWRGVLSVSTLQASKRVVPDQITQALKKSSQTVTPPPSPKESAATKENAEQTVEQQSTADQPQKSEASDASLNTATPAIDDAQKDEKPSVPTELPFEPTIDLRQGLVLLYVKSGNNVMARLPIVPGLSPIAIAELPSDVRRLEAEAFVKGFQAEVFDLVGMRNLLASRARKLINDKRVEEAQQIVKQIRELPTYTEMADALETLQRKMLDETNEPISLAAKNRIDRMFQLTRESIQKYLQEDIGGKLDEQMRQAK